MPWHVYVGRTGLDVDAWLVSNNVTSHAKLCSACESLNVIPPPKEAWKDMNPKRRQASKVPDKEPVLNKAPATKAKPKKPPKKHASKVVDEDETLKKKE